jgi:hypothetical protein
MASNLHGPWVGEKTGLTAIRAQNCYYLYLGDKVAGMGDGVNTFFYEDGSPIWPDTADFSLMMQDVVDDATTVEAYFYEDFVMEAA